jgi:hypothetical protein
MTRTTDTPRTPDTTGWSAAGSATTGSRTAASATAASATSAGTTRSPSRRRRTLVAVGVAAALLGTTALSVAVLRDDADASSTASADVVPAPYSAIPDFDEMGIAIPPVAVPYPAGALADGATLVTASLASPMRPSGTWALTTPQLVFLAGYVAASGGHLEVPDAWTLSPGQVAFLTGDTSTGSAAG